MTITNQALQYVVNTNGNAKVQHFWEDFEPVGVRLWTDLLTAGLVEVREDDRIYLTDKGKESLG